MTEVEEQQQVSNLPAATVDSSDLKAAAKKEAKEAKPVVEKTIVGKRTIHRLLHFILAFEAHFDL